MLKLEHLQLNIRELAEVLSTGNIYILEYKENAAKTFKAIVVYGVVAGNHRTVYDWFTKSVKHRVLENAEPRTVRGLSADYF